MATDQQTRYFEFQDDKSAKFWEVTTDGTAVTVRYGKIGTNGQSQTKVLADVAAAAKHVAKLVAEKTGKGYVESGQDAESQVASDPFSEMAPTAPRKKAASRKEAVVTYPAKDPDASPESLLALLNKDDTTNRLLARHPRASADLLEKLSHSSDKATRQGVAANPNTPPETYVKLGQQFPKEFLANPALDLLLMLNPALMEEVPEALLVRLLKQTDCPPSLLTWAAGTSNSKVQLAVAMNANAPESARQRLGKSFDPAVREAVKPMAEDAPEQEPEQAFVQALRERIGSLSWYELEEAWITGDIGLAQWSALPLTFKLAQNTNSEEFSPACVARVLRDSGRTLEEIRALLPDYRGWGEVAKHPFTPGHVLVELSKDSNYLVRRGVAENQSTPVAVLEALAKDSNNRNQLSVFFNPSTPEPLKVQLLGALDVNLFSSDMKEVATNPATPAPVLEKLSNLADKWIRLAVAGNLATPVPVLEALASHSDRDIQCAVAENPSTPVPVLETIAKSFNGLIRCGVAKNPAIPVPVLEALACDSEHEVRRAVAKNPAATVSVLETLARDSDVWVRCAVAGNPNTAPTVLEKLSKDREEFVKETAICNPNTPLPALIKLVSVKAVGVRQALASQSHRSPEILHGLWKDTHDSVRQAVASCPGLTQAQLDELLQDCELETDLATLLDHPNLSVKGVKYIFDMLCSTQAVGSAWYRRKLAEASAEIRAAAHADQVTFYHGKDPNKAVLAKRTLAPVMALCAGPFIEPTRLVKVVGSTDWLVRAAVARNPGTPPNLIKKLSADAHPVVAALANWTIGSSIELRKDTQAPEEAAEDRTPDLTLAVAEVLSRFDKQKPDMFYDLASNAARDETWSDYLSLPALITGLDWFESWRTKLGPGIEARLTTEQKHLLLEAGLSSPNYHVRKSIAQWSDCPPACLEKLLKDKEPAVQLAALNHPTLSHARRMDIINKISNMRIKKMAQLLKDEKNVFEFMEIFSESEDEEVRLFVADNQNTPAHILKKLSADKLNSVRKFVAKNANTPVGVLVELANDPEDDVRCSVAGNPNTPTQVLDDLASNLKERWDNNIGGNPNTPTHVLESLANAGSGRVRKLVAGNPSTPAHVLAAMSNDKNQDIRKEVSGNINTPATILEKLSKDEDYEVRMRVASNKNTPIQVLEELASDVDEFVLRNLSVNPNAPKKFLEETLHHEILEIKYDVAENPNAPALVLEELANDKAIWVRRLLANNPNTPLHVLEELAKDIDEEVILGLTRTHNTPPELVKHLESITTLEHESRAMDALDRIERSILRESCKLKGIPAEQPNPITPAALLRALGWLGYFTPSDDNKALTKASRSKDWLVRLGAALHPDATEGILKLLRQDADPSVARAAQFRQLKAA